MQSIIITAKYANTQDFPSKSKKFSKNQAKKKGIQSMQEIQEATLSNSSQDSVFDMQSSVESTCRNQHTSTADAGGNANSLLDFLFSEKTDINSKSGNNNTQNSTNTSLNKALQSPSSSSVVTHAKSSNISEKAYKDTPPKASQLTAKSYRSAQSNSQENDKPKSKNSNQSQSCQAAQSTPIVITPIDVNLIVPNPSQPRHNFSEASILKLADSIRQFGIIQPLTVRKLGHHYELIAGERRLRAAKELGWSSVPCIINEVSEEKSAQISIIENLLRENLNIFEQAMAIEALIDTYNLTQEQVAEKLSSSQSYIANKLRLLRLSTEEREKILENNLTERHARALLRINDQNLRNKILETVINNELNVSSTENLVSSSLENNISTENNAHKKTKLYRDIPSFYNAVTKAIDCAKSSNLGIKCRKIVGESFTELTILIPNEPNTQEPNTSIEEI